MSPLLANCASVASRTFHFGVAYLYRQRWDEARARRQGSCVRSHRSCHLGNAHGASGAVAQDVCI